MPDDVFGFLQGDFDYEELPRVILGQCDLKATSVEEVYIYLNHFHCHALQAVLACFNLPSGYVIIDFM